MIPVKKSFCVFLCVLMLFGSVAVVGFAENVNDSTHQSGCDCTQCAPDKAESDFSYVEPTADTTLESKGPIEDLISEIAGDELVEAGKKNDVNKIMAIGEKITAQIRDFFAKLADFAAELSERFLKLFRIK